MLCVLKPVGSRPDLLAEQDSNYDVYYYILQDGEPDASFFAPDCFHFSSKGHAAAGQELWNNMVRASYCEYFDNCLLAFFQETNENIILDTLRLVYDVFYA